MFKTMCRLVCILLIWNVILTVSLAININQQREEKLNNEILSAEMIPTDLEVLEDL